MPTIRLSISAEARPDRQLAVLEVGAGAACVSVIVTLSRRHMFK
jgi:precorrin-6B methylase 2